MPPSARVAAIGAAARVSGDGVLTPSPMRVTRDTVVSPAIPTPAKELNTPVGEMATALGMNPEDVMRRIDRMIRRLKIEIPVPRAAG